MRASFPKDGRRKQRKLQRKKYCQNRVSTIVKMQEVNTNNSKTGRTMALTGRKLQLKPTKKTQKSSVIHSNRNFSTNFTFLGQSRTFQTTWYQPPLVTKKERPVAKYLKSPIVKRIEKKTRHQRSLVYTTEEKLVNSTKVREQVPYKGNIFKARFETFRFLAALFAL